MTGPARGADTRTLVDELTAVLGGARHEAGFIVDEVLAAPGRLAPDGKRQQRSGIVLPEAAQQARAMARRRVAGEPLQYIFGHWPFRRLDLRVDPRVLIPRPETEQVVEVALVEARRLRATHPGTALVAVDAGTGSGAIALALAAELGCADLKEIWATDASAAALEVAATNLAACRDAIVAREKGCCDGRSAFPLVKLTKGSWLTPLPERLRGSVDLVVSNPPYVTEEEWATLTPEVRAEPRGALVAGPGREGAPGLADVERVLEEGLLWLRLPGVIVVELAPHQAPAAERCALQLGYEQVRIEPDLAMRPRTLVARLGGAQGSE